MHLKNELLSGPINPFDTFVRMTKNYERIGLGFEINHVLNNVLYKHIRVIKNEIDANSRFIWCLSRFQWDGERPTIFINEKMGIMQKNNLEHEFAF